MADRHPTAILINVAVKPEKPIKSKGNNLFQMKLESLKSSKFEVLTTETMRHVVGGQAHTTGSVSLKNDNTKYSNDAVDRDGINHVVLGGGDWGAAMLRQYVGAENA